MRYHFFFFLLWFPYQKGFFIYFFAKLWIFFTFTFTPNWCSIFFFPFLFAGSRLFMMEGWMDEGWMHRWMGAIPVFYFGKRGGLLFLHCKCGWTGILEAETFFLSHPLFPAHLTLFPTVRKRPMRFGCLEWLCFFSIFGFFTLLSLRNHAME